MKDGLTFMMLAALFLVAQSCRNPKDGVGDESVPVDSLLYADSVVLPAPIPDSISASLFETQMAKVAPMLLAWGFAKLGDSSYRNRHEFSKHWCLKSFVENSSKNIGGIPNTKNWQSINVISQVAYQSTNRVWVLEEWQLADKHAARSWLTFINNSNPLRERYPHRLAWSDGAALFMIMTGSPSEWTDHGDSLIEAFTGRRKALVQLFANPIDVETYKKKKMGSNSGGDGGHSFYFKPDTTGFYYRYFWFIQLRSRYPADILFQGLILTTYIYGEPKSYYPAVQEELIAIKSKVADPDLGQLDLVGKDRSEIETNLGLWGSPEQDYVIEAFDGDILIIHCLAGKVDWYNYLRTTLEVEKDGLPEILKYYEERLPKPK